MRIISGKYKRKHLNVPQNFCARPTTDFAKTGLFNIISNNFNMQEIEVLDLFSGTGSIGFEFASRGAVFIEMVENNPIHFRFIKKTVDELKIENIRLHKTDAFIFIPRCKNKYDIIFADPPYDMPRTEIIPELICKSRLLKPYGWLIIEHSVNNSFSSYSWFHELRKYGNVHFSFFRNF